MLVPWKVSFSGSMFKLWAYTHLQIIIFEPPQFTTSSGAPASYPLEHLLDQVQNSVMVTWKSRKICWSCRIFTDSIIFFGVKDLQISNWNWQKKTFRDTKSRCKPAFHQLSKLIDSRHQHGSFRNFTTLTPFPPPKWRNEKKKKKRFVQLRILEMLIFQLCCSIHFFHWQTWINARFRYTRRMMFCDVLHIHLQPKKLLIHFNTLLMATRNLAFSWGKGSLPPLFHGVLAPSKRWFEIAGFFWSINQKGMRVDASFQVKGHHQRSF